MTPPQQLCLVLADLVLLVHAAFVAFVVIGLLWIWVGRFRRWFFVRNFWFRMAHLVAMGMVATESTAGFICPLTTWEDRLRLLAGDEQRYQGSFIQHWVHRVIFFDVDESVFMVVYVFFFAVVALTIWLVPPRWPSGNRPRANF